MKQKNKATQEFKVLDCFNGQELENALNSHIGSGWALMEINEERSEFFHVNKVILTRFNKEVRKWQKKKLRKPLS
ncbi:Uncharacterised protein [uncultured archaeon]|nr:Uncharacterised protein [uncultured archaeon]